MGLLDRKSKFSRREELELRRFKRSVINSVNGLKVSYIEEKSLILHLVITIIVIISGFVFKLNLNDWLFVILFMGLILCIELLNTAIEATVDLATDKIHPLAKKAKDVGSGASFMMSVFAIIGGLIIFIPHIIEFFK